MNYYKNKFAIFYFVLIGLVLITATMGCGKKYLDRMPLGQYTSENYPFPENTGPFDQYVFAAYASLRTFEASTWGFLGAVNIRSEDANKGSSIQDLPELKQMDDFPVTVSNSLVSDLWIANYATINNCNIVLDQVAKDKSNASETNKMLASAEARFLRGYSYFLLVRIFGNIPIVDTLINDVSQSNIPQSSPSEVYAFIEKDLQFAAMYLPLRWDEKFIGRATSGAANGLLTKVYLYEKKWQLVLNTADIVINSGVYDLKTPYDDIFTEKGENCSESIFEIQAYQDASSPEDYGSYYAYVQGVRGRGQLSLGWGFNVPSDALVNAYEPGDPREKSTILYCPSKEPTRYGEVFPVAPNPMYNMKVYTDPTFRSKVGQTRAQWVNIRILRYSDLLLMYAEAANELGQTVQALAKLEMVRARARNGNNAILPPVTTTVQSELRDAIRHERRIEFAMEHERFFDIVRWGIAESVLHNAGKGNFNAARDVLFPIPQTQIDLSKGVLKQNPGY